MLLSTRTDIRNIQAKAANKLSEEELAIFDAHLEFTNDPGLIDQVIAMINSDSVNAEYALDFVANTFITMFEAMEDAYFKRTCCGHQRRYVPN